jgi:hypothetical protein
MKCRLLGSLMLGTQAGGGPVRYGFNGQPARRRFLCSTWNPFLPPTRNPSQASRAEAFMAAHLARAGEGLGLDDREHEARLAQIGASTVSAPPAVYVASRCDPGNIDTLPSQ